MAGRLIGKGSANSSTVASPSASRRTIERRVGSDRAAKTTSNRSGALTVIDAVAPADTSQVGYLTEQLHVVKGPRRASPDRARVEGRGGLGQHGRRAERYRGGERSSSGAGPLPRRPAETDASQRP